MTLVAPTAGASVAQNPYVNYDGASVVVNAPSAKAQPPASEFAQGVAGLGIGLLVAIVLAWIFTSEWKRLS